MKANTSALFGLFLSAIPCVAQDPAQPEKNPTPAAAQAGDEQAIRAMIAGFEQAFGKGDAAAIAGLFTEKGEAVDLDGNAIQGREALQAHYADRFASAPGDKLATEVELIHFLAPDLARHDGRSRVSPPDGGQASSFRYTATLAKDGQGWKIASLRELEDPAISHHERLKELEWLVGEWVEETGDAVISASLDWSEDQNFLIRSFEVRVEGKPTLKGTQRIGWDPLTKQIKSWVFDSRGGYGEGFWNRSGDRWIVKSSGVRPDGQTTSATQVLTRINKDRILWKSTDRTLGGETRDDIDEFVMARKPPEPR